MMRNSLSSLWNPFDRLLRRARKQNARKFLICWNRGLGDIPLGLFALVSRIRHFLPDAEVTFLTRKDLVEGFSMLENIAVLAAPDWRRGTPFDLINTLQQMRQSASNWDVILEKPDPTRWLRWQLGTLTPRLYWNPEWNRCSDKFVLEGRAYVGVHAQTETHYNYEKNWPLTYWREFFCRSVDLYQIRPILFGFSPQPAFVEEGIIDLRGKTTFLEMMAIIKNHCQYLLVPDSGVLSMAYYLDSTFPIKIVSLWADPRQGVLKQQVDSPNPLLQHHPLVGKNKDLYTVSVDTVLKRLYAWN